MKFIILKYCATTHLGFFLNVTVSAYVWKVERAEKWAGTFSLIKPGDNGFNPLNFLIACLLWVDYVRQKALSNLHGL